MAATVHNICPFFTSNWICIRHTTKIPISLVLRRLQSTSPSAEIIEREEDDLYPHIKPPYPPGIWGDIEKKKAWELHDKGEELKTIPNAKERLEKMAGSEDIAMNRILSHDKYPFTLKFKQYVTKTHLVNGLPEVYNSINVDQLFADHKSLIIDTVLDDNEVLKQQLITKKVPQTEIQWAKTHDLIGKLLYKLFVSMSPTQEHLMLSQIDENVRSECFWRRTGFNFYPPRNPLPGSLFFQHLTNVDWQLRTELPLPQFIDPSDDMCKKGDYPLLVDHHPKYYGATYMKTRPFSVSGHWIGDPCEFTQLGIYCQSKSHEWFLGQYGEEAVREQGINTALTASFGSCVAQAHNQGFNWLMDLTYPFTTQTIFTNGESVRFAAYQLNTLDLWKSDEAVPIRNICWVTDEQPLYEKLENGKVHGLNEDVFKQLLKMLVLQPADRGVDLRPHLPEEVAPRYTHTYINKLGEPTLYIPKIERWQYPRNAAYF